MKNLRKVNVRQNNDEDFFGKKMKLDLILWVMDVQFLLKPIFLFG